MQASQSQPSPGPARATAASRPSRSSGLTRAASSSWLSGRRLRGMPSRSYMPRLQTPGASRASASQQPTAATRSAAANIRSRRAAACQLLGTFRRGQVDAPAVHRRVEAVAPARVVDAGERVGPDALHERTPGCISTSSRIITLRHLTRVWGIVRAACRRGPGVSPTRPSRRHPRSRRGRTGGGRGAHGGGSRVRCSNPHGRYRASSDQPPATAGLHPFGVRRIRRRGRRVTTRPAGPRRPVVPRAVLQGRRSP